MLDKKTRKKVYERVRKRFKRLARKLGKDFREVTIDNKLFKEALEDEISREKVLQEKGQESRLRKTNIDQILEEAERTPIKRKSPHDWLANPSDAKRHSEKCQCSKCLGGFSDPDLINEPIPESPEREAERKAIEERVNEQLDKEWRDKICPTCYSYPCVCDRQSRRYYDPNEGEE